MKKFLSWLGGALMTALMLVAWLYFAGVIGVAIVGLGTLLLVAGFVSWLLGKDDVTL